MGTIKIGEAEEKLISEIERIKEKHKKRMEGVCLGLSVARRQIPEAEDNVTQAIIKELDRTITCVNYLARAIQGIEFSEEHDEEKFLISWAEIYDKTGTYYKYGYGTTKPVTKKQFVFALEAWDREVCKRSTLVKELERGYPFDSICADIEDDIHKLLYAYVRDF